MSNRKKRINNIPDLILLLLFLGIGIYFAIEAIIGKLIPSKYIFIFLILLLGLFVGIFFTFKVRNQTFRILRKVFLGCMCIGLLLGSVFQGKVRSAFSNVGDGSTTIDRMFVVTLKQDTSELEDIQTIGHLDQSSGLLTYSLQQLSSYHYKMKMFEQVHDELEALKDHKIDALLLSAQDHSVLDEDEFARSYQIIKTIEMKVQTSTSLSQVDVVKEPFVVYLSGMDEMGLPDYNGLSDVNMLMMVDPLRHHVELISINRDTYVPNDQYKDAPDKLTHLGWNGVESGKKALEKIFGIEIDYTAKVTFESFIKMIDTLGGIDVDVLISFTEQNEDRSFASSDLIHLEKGYQHLNGSQALAYARHRKTEGWDVKGREQAQRDIIAATVKKLLSVEGALKVGDVLNVVASYVSTNMSMDSAKAFVMHAIDEGAKWSFSSNTVNSDYEFLFPCASLKNQDLYAVLLQEADIYRIHDLYESMHEKMHLNDFSFDMDDLDASMKSFDLNQKVITVENYYDVVGKYFPKYLRYHLEG